MKKLHGHPGRIAFVHDVYVGLSFSHEEFPKRIKEPYQGKAGWKHVGREYT